ncbi:hypothetical protein FQR65_LT17118 [Abscondita terminalis]|nr:hypothetical protein FQR65_LT17118 [Abscondita terminalis]
MKAPLLILLLSENDSMVRWLATESEVWYAIAHHSHRRIQQTTAIQGEISVGTGGVTEAFKQRVVMPVMQINQQTRHVLGHELVHAFQYRVLIDGGSAGSPEYSPAMSISATDEIVYSYFKNNAYSVYYAKSSDFTGTIVDAGSVNFDAAMLPPPIFRNTIRSFAALNVNGAEIQDFGGQIAYITRKAASTGEPRCRIFHIFSRIHTNEFEDFGYGEELSVHTIKCALFTNKLDVFVAYPFNRLQMELGAAVVNIDLRKYNRYKPVTIAARLYSYSRFGSNENALYPFYIGYPYLIRGYESGDFDRNGKVRNLDLTGIGTAIFNFERLAWSKGNKVVWSSDDRPIIPLKDDTGNVIVNPDTNLPEMGYDPNYKIPVMSAGVSLRIICSELWFWKAINYAFFLSSRRILNPDVRSEFTPGCSIKIDEENKTAAVYLKCRSGTLAIGRGGHNIKLAGKLTGLTKSMCIVRMTNSDEDVDSKNSATKIEGWVIDELKRVGLDTANLSFSSEKSLNAPEEPTPVKAEIPEEKNPAEESSASYRYEDRRKIGSGQLEAPKETVVPQVQKPAEPAKPKVEEVKQEVQAVKKEEVKPAEPAKPTTSPDDVIRARAESLSGPKVIETQAQAYERSEYRWRTTRIRIEAETSTVGKPSKAVKGGITRVTEDRVITKTVPVIIRATEVQVTIRATEVQEITRKQEDHQKKKSRIQIKATLARLSGAGKSGKFAQRAKLPPVRKRDEVAHHAEEAALEQENDGQCIESNRVCYGK